jgi:hypothetical protein
MGGMWKLMYKEECGNEYMRENVKITIRGGIWKLMY